MTAPTRMTASDAQLRSALSHANLPTLLLVMAQLTGDSQWTADPYRPSPLVVLDDNDSGGFDQATQDDIRNSAFDILRDWRDGGQPPPTPPTPEQIVTLLSFSLGEKIPPEYGPSMAQEAGWLSRDVQWRTPAPPTTAKSLHVLIIGAGVAGICTAIKLTALGIPFTIVERNDGVGGVWRENTYPGAGVDTPSYLYSYSFAPRANWLRYFSKQPEILDYLEQIADGNGVIPHIRFGREVTTLAWDGQTRTWTATLSSRPGNEGGAEKLVAHVVVSCVGQLNRPYLPDIPGLDTFAGPVFHSARWRHDVPVAGRRIGVIGSGASAMQLVPALAGQAATITIFQRSPQWMLPNPNYLREVEPAVSLLMEQVPLYSAWYRLRQQWMYQDRIHPTLQKDPNWTEPQRSLNEVNELHRSLLTYYIEAQLNERPDLLDKVVPSYPPYGKRMLMDNAWFQTLRREDVELVNEAVTRIDGSSVVTASGQRRDVDVLVLATGFESLKILGPMEVFGREGRSLRKEWGEDDAWAYLGMTVPGYPNFFMTYGPNTNLGHGGSAIFHLETQVAYITSLLREMAETGLSFLEVRPEVCAAYNERVDEAHSKMIWTHPGMRNWYRNAAGRVVSNSPWRLVDYGDMAANPDLSDFWFGM